MLLSSLHLLNQPYAAGNLPGQVGFTKAGNAEQSDGIQALQLVTAQHLQGNTMQATGVSCEVCPLGGLICGVLLVIKPHAHLHLCGELYVVLMHSTTELSAHTQLFWSTSIRKTFLHQWSANLFTSL